MENAGGHVPVLYKETLELLNLRPGMTVVDGTLGGAGHARGVLEQILPGGRLVGIDKDEAAIKRAQKAFESEKDNVTLVKDDFKNIKGILAGLQIEKIDAAMLDLGVSSYQLDEGERGFSYNQNAALDMRMDNASALSAKRVVNEYSQSELHRIIKEYGEERWAKRIAEFIVKERSVKEIETTGELTRIIKAAIPKGARKDGPHPAKRTFQAIRIEVNGELAGLGDAMEAYAAALSPGGRLCVITFHSLEDRIVKQTFKKLNDPCECPKDFPQCVCGKVKTVEIVTRKPVLPAKEETETNPRARSAKLRAIQKI
ncbi:MAG: 16S rRNA (cytosine(1402)-N(4))-methyltransferase RsmH [Christensenellaceae bacterium]|jgi:16S rRNA (cytosine1402-N4)-methyltransferase